MTEELKVLISLAGLILAVGAIVWHGGKIAKVVEQLAELMRDHEVRIRILEDKKAKKAPKAKRPMLVRETLYKPARSRRKK